VTAPPLSPLRAVPRRRRSFAWRAYAALGYGGRSRCGVCGRPIVSGQTALLTQGDLAHTRCARAPAATG
jgi:hypothetical protein